MTKDERIAELEKVPEFLAMLKAENEMLENAFNLAVGKFEEQQAKLDVAMAFGRELAEELTTAWVECIECDGEDGSCKVCNGHGWVRMLDKTPLLTLWEQRLDQMASTRQSEQ